MVMDIRGNETHPCNSSFSYMLHKIKLYICPFLRPDRLSPTQSISYAV